MDEAWSLTALIGAPIKSPVCVRELTHVWRSAGYSWRAPGRAAGLGLLMDRAMPRTNLWDRTVPRVALDHRSREARLRLEQLERLFISLVAVGQAQARLRRILYLFRARAPLAIDVSPALTAAMQEGSEASIRLRETAKSPDREQHRRVMREWLAAQQRRREAWLAMATPLPQRRITGESRSSPTGSRLRAVMTLPDEWRGFGQGAADGGT
jgi:hypothetical protein